MLTKKEILGRLEDDGIDMGDNPGRVFDYYVERGLILRPKKRRKRLGLYPDKTVEIIKEIKHLQTLEKSLSEIQKKFDRKRKEEAEKYKDHLNDRIHLQEVFNRVKKIIKIDEDIGCDLYVLEKVNKKENERLFFALVCFSENGKINWINIDITVTGEEKFLGKKTMSSGEYITFIQVLAHEQMGKGKVLKRKNIFEAIFSMYFT